MPLTVSDAESKYYAAVDPTGAIRTRRAAGDALAEVAKQYAAKYGVAFSEAFRITCAANPEVTRKYLP